MLQVAVSLNGRPVGKWPLDRPRLSIGRSPENEIQLDTHVVSRRHAVLEQQGEGFALRDLGTVNGTYLNGARVEGVHALREGDTIQIGAFALVFGSDAAASVAMKRPPKKSSAIWAAVPTGGRVSAEDRDSRERAAAVKAYLVLNSSPGPPRVIDKDLYQIGKDPACDLRLEGIFAPRKLALIVRGHGGWKLVNVTADGKRVERNGAPVADQAWLDDGDRLLLYDSEVAFHDGTPLDAAETRPTAP